MTERDDGGPAFAAQFTEYTLSGKVAGFKNEHGMSLRDWFAGQALAALPDHLKSFQTDHRIKIAEWAYGMADAMIAERNK